MKILDKSQDFLDLKAGSNLIYVVRGNVQAKLNVDSLVNLEETEVLWIENSKNSVASLQLESGSKVALVRVSSSQNQR